MVQRKFFPEVNGPERLVPSPKDRAILRMEIRKVSRSNADFAYYLGWSEAVLSRILNGRVVLKENEKMMLEKALGKNRLELGLEEE